MKLSQKSGFDLLKLLLNPLLIFVGQHSLIIRVKIRDRSNRFMLMGASFHTSGPSYRCKVFNFKVSRKERRSLLSQGRFVPRDEEFLVPNKMKEIFSFRPFGPGGIHHSPGERSKIGAL
jgi:hypothetical protein